jgi:hypothetical protein
MAWPVRSAAAQVRWIGAAVEVRVRGKGLVSMIAAMSGEVISKGSDGFVPVVFDASSPHGVSLRERVRVGTSCKGGANGLIPH